MTIQKLKDYKIVIVVGLLFIITLLTFLGFYFNVFTKNMEIDFGTCSPEDYGCVTEVAVVNAKNTSINESLEKLYQFYSTTTTDPIHCHRSLHLVGSYFFEAFAEESFNGVSNVCAGAYYHGVLFGGVQGNSRTDSPASISLILNNICNNSSKILGDVSRTCVHGVGHAAYLFYEDLEPAINVCLQSRYTEDYLDSCLAGAFMEPAYSPLNGENFRFTPFEYCDTYKKYGERMVLKNCLFYSLSHKILDRQVSLDQFCSLGILEDKTYCEKVYGTTLGYSLADSTDPRIQKFNISDLKKECLANQNCRASYENSFSFLTGLDSGGNPFDGVWKS